MRKIFKSFMLVAAAAMAFTSCQKEETAAPETVSATLTMHADVEQTKTYLENNTVLWGKGEAVTLYVGAGETAKFFDSASTDAYDGKESASFTFEIKDVTEADSYALGGIYPESAAMDDNKNAKQYKVILPATQNQVDGNYDPSAYIMVLKPEVVTELPAEYTASFRRATALNKITLTGVKEDISSVEITVPEKKYLAGRRYMDLTTGESGEVYYDQSNKVTVNSSFTGNSIDVWFTSWGVELAEGDELSIKMTSATKTYSRTIAARAEGIKFIEGDLNTLTVNMSSATVETLDNFSGEYLIVNTDLTRAAQAWANGNNLPEFVLNARDGVVYESEGIENCKMTIEAQADGKYTIKDANGLYLYAASSSSNHLMGQTTASSWTIEQDGDKYVLTSSAQTSRNIMKYNEQSKIFSCYSSGQKDITLYKYSDIKVDTTPSISLTKNSDQVAFDATSYEFTYTTKNIAGNLVATIKDGATMTNVSASASNGTVTVKFNANAEADQKTATIVLSYEGAESKEFVLTQAGKSASGEETGWISTAFTNLKNGDQVVIVGVKSSTRYAMSNDKGTSSGPTLVKVTISGDKLSENPADNIVWTVGVDGENRIFYANAAKTTWLYCTATNNGVRVGTNTNKTFAWKNNYLQHVSTSRYLGIYNTQDWRCYTSNTTANIANQSFEFYVKAGGNTSGGETPEPEPEPEPEPGTGGSTVDFTFSSASSVTLDGVTVACNKANGSNAPAWTSSQLRLYANNTIVVSSTTKTFTRIEYVFTKQGSKAYATASGPSTFTSGGTSTGNDNEVTDVWTGSSNSVTVTLGSSGQRVLKSIKVYCN